MKPSQVNHNFETQQLISVIMGTHCKAEELGRMECAVESILNQTHQNIRLIVCDTGACEGAKAWLRKRTKEDPRLILLDDRRLDSLQKKLNACLAHVAGAWVARMDDDDRALPERLAVQLVFLQEHPEISVVGSNVCEVDRKGSKRLRTLPAFPEKEDFRFKIPFVHPALLFRYEVLKDLGGYSESCWHESCEDYELLMRLYAARFRGANIQKPLLEYSVVNSKEKRKRYRYRINEFVTRLISYQRLHKLLFWMPYALKPLAVGLIPLPFLNWLRENFSKDT